jgi:hypothetical protein
MTDNDISEELDAIRLEIKELLDNASRLVRGTREEERAKGYWIAHIRCALDKEHGYLGGSMVTMQDTIDALRGNEEDE